MEIVELKLSQTQVEIVKSALSTQIQDYNNILSQLGGGAIGGALEQPSRIKRKYVKKDKIQQPIKYKLEKRKPSLHKVLRDGGSQKELYDQIPQEGITTNELCKSLNLSFSTVSNRLTQLRVLLEIDDEKTEINEIVQEMDWSFSYRDHFGEWPIKSLEIVDIDIE